MEPNSLKRSHDTSSGKTSHITWKRKYFINRARAGQGKVTANTASEHQEETEAVSVVEELQTLSVDDYQTLLQILKISFPEGVLNSKVTERSTDPKLIRDVNEIIRDVRKAKLTVVDKPRLSCVKIKQAHELKQRGKIADLVRILFFKECKKASENSLKRRWEKNSPESGCMFRMRDMLTEMPSTKPEMLASSTGRGKRWFGKPEDNKNNAEDCFRFFLQQKGLDIEDAQYKHEITVESGFISGRLDYLLDVPAESSETSQKEKIIIECKGTRGSMVGDVFTLPHGEGHLAEFNASHQYYHQTQAYRHILQQKVHPLPVRAVMVVKISAEHAEPKFYWGEVKDTQHIQELNNFCQEEVLPRFLTALNLIFLKGEEREGDGLMEREEKLKRAEDGGMKRVEQMERGGDGVMDITNSP